MHLILQMNKLLILQTNRYYYAKYTYINYTFLGTNLVWYHKKSDHPYTKLSKKQITSFEIS